MLGWPLHVVQMLWGHPCLVSQPSELIASPSGLARFALCLGVGVL